MKCKTCGKNSQSDYCFIHKPRKPLSSGKGLSKKSSKPQLDKPSEMKKFFMNIWKNKPHFSEISNKLLYEPPSTAYFHHILSKSKYPEAKFDEENIILLTIDEHANVESSMFRYEKINKIREKLLTKYKYI